MGVAGGGVRADPSTELIKGEEGKRTSSFGDHKLPPKELQDTGCWDCGGRRGHEHLFLTQRGQLTSLLLLGKVFKHLLQFTIRISRIRPEACNYILTYDMQSCDSRFSRLTCGRLVQSWLGPCSCSRPLSLTAPHCIGAEGEEGNHTRSVWSAQAAEGSEGAPNYVRHLLSKCYNHI